MPAFRPRHALPLASYLIVQDTARPIAFYGNAFGFRLIFKDIDGYRRGFGSAPDNTAE